MIGIGIERLMCGGSGSRSVFSFFQGFHRLRRMAVVYLQRGVVQKTRFKKTGSQEEVAGRATTKRPI